jgi:hypothetical protein
MSASAEITVFTKHPHPGDPYGTLLSKRIALGDDGTPVSDGTPCRMATGTAITLPVPNAVMFAEAINRHVSYNALSLGSTGHAVGIEFHIATAKTLASLPKQQRGNGVIARTREYFQFRCTPTWALLELDRKGMPLPVQGRLEASGGFESALFKVVPGLAAAARVIRASTSAGLSHRETGERYPSSGGLHDYILVQDGTDIDRATKVAHDRAWLHGLGWFLIGGAGQLLERSIIDTAVRFPERLVFEGAPDVVPPLVQDQAVRAAVAVDGVAIDTWTVIPDLTSAERQQVAALKAAARRVLEPEAMLIRAAADNCLVAQIVQRTGVPHVVAMRQVAARHRGVLTPDIELVTDHRGTVTVREILADPESFIDETLCDPMEGPEYGFGKAKIMWSQRNPGRLFIHSFAHGGGSYDLKHDLRSAAALLEAADVKTIADVLCDVVDSADLEADEVQQLIELAALRGKLKLRPLIKRLKDDRARRDRARRKAAALAAQAVGVADQRERRPLPYADAELAPVLADLDQVLAADASDYPPMRRPDGTLVKLVTETPFELHQLAATGSNAEADPDEGVLPAPPEPTLKMLTPITTELLIEKYFVWEKYDKNGNLIGPATLPRPFIDAFMQMTGSESRLPHVNAINTAPMVAMDGSIIDGVGLDRDTGLYHFIELGLRDCVPQGEITALAVREAMRFLCEDWLVDVLTDLAGKFTIIVLAVTLLERHLLKIRPAFLISAGQRGGGKTTLAHMLFCAVFGRMAPAASWSESQEERRKALFAYFLAMVAGLLWDNIKNGTEISCPEIEKALTSPTISDRILSVSRSAIVNTTAVQIFIGNNIRFAGDMASRGPEIRLATDDPRPEDRQVAHADPLSWTMTYRARIMRSLYTILIYGCRNRPAGQQAKTRFRDWWSLCAWPVELAASLFDPPVPFDILSVFRATEAQDSKAMGIASALRLLRQEFGSVERGSVSKDGWFRARQIREILDAGKETRTLLRYAPMADKAPIERAGAFLEMYAELAGKPHPDPIPKLISAALGAIKDRGVDLDDTTVGILRVRELLGNLQFRVETHASHS